MTARVRHPGPLAFVLLAMLGVFAAASSNDRASRANLDAHISEVLALLGHDQRPDADALADAAARLTTTRSRNADAEIIARTFFAEGLLYSAAEDWPAARSAYRQADATLDAPRTLRRDARFNLAHTLHSQAAAAIAQPPSESPAAMDPDTLDAAADALIRAADAFRSCLDLDPADAAAARNAERCRRLAQQHRDAAERIRQAEQQAREQAQQNANDAADALDQLAEQQENLADQSRTADAAESDRLANEQDQTSGATTDAAEQLRQLQQEARERGNDDAAEAYEQALEQLRQARAEQESASQQLERDDPASAVPPQQAAADALRAAADRAREAASREGQDPADQSQPGEQGEGEPQPSDQRQPAENQDAQEPGDPVAERILERERRQREARELRRSRLARPVPVEKDW